MSSIDLAVSVGDVELATPIIAASGTYAYGAELDGLVDWKLVGGVCVKGLSAEPSSGHAAPRMAETSGGVLNAIGLQNIGVAAFATDKLPLLRQLGPRVIANCWGNTLDDYARVIELIDALDGVDVVEVNVSCPHKHEWGGILAADLAATTAIVTEVRRRTKLPLWVKLSPNVTDIVEGALAVEAAGADAVVAINTLRGLAVDVETRRPVLANGSGGLSGPAIKPVALHMVRAAAAALSIPVVGVGGIMTGRDAAEFLIAGASAVEVGTACLYDPAAPARIAAELSAVLEDLGETSASALVGTLDAQRRPS
ncbi:MAG: dihydroorotate dehydrogenase (NAD+) catalytic subunit [Hyphomicrobiaceae bacterium]|jgi:dihydroorotate dehydrogenase (NAD+) catalytic subunit